MENKKRNFLNKSSMKKNRFIQQTADDYGIPYNTVEYFYDLWYDVGRFYEKLEEHIKNFCR